MQEKVTLQIKVPRKVFDFCTYFAKVYKKSPEEYVLLGLKGLIAAELTYASELSSAPEQASYLGLGEFLKDPDAHYGGSPGLTQEPKKFPGKQGSHRLRNACQT